MNEEWKDIKGFEGLYQVSTMGNVRKLRFINNYVNKEKVFSVTPQPNGTGYLKVMLWKESKHQQKLVHRLVAEAFIDNPEGKLFVNHKDGVKTNNRLDNLEWCTGSENMHHAFRTGLWSPAAKGRYGENSYKAIPVLMIDKNTGETIKRFGSLIDAAHYIGKKKSCNIVSCCKGKLKSAHGYVWRYAG